MSTAYIKEDISTTGHPALHLLPLVSIPSMAPYFIRNLIPRRQAHDENRKPLLEVILSLTGVQWAQFLTGYDTFLSRPLPKLMLALGGLLGPVTQSIFSTLLSASRACKCNSIKPRQLPSYVTIKIFKRRPRGI